ncbi:DUF3810 family protein, partial [Lacticaseibacillus paracasei]
MVVLWVYILFNAFWGLNYNRVGIAKQLNLEVKKVEKDEIAAVMQILLRKVNHFDSLASLSRQKISN